MHMGNYPMGVTAPRRDMYTRCPCHSSGLGNLSGGILSKIIKASTPGPNSFKLQSTPKEIKKVIAVAGPALSAIPGWGTLAAGGAAIITAADQRAKAQRLQAAAASGGEANAILQAYQEVAGQVPGRLIGVSTLEQVAQAAGRAGLWPNVKRWSDAVVPEVVRTGCKGCTPPTMQDWVRGNVNGNPLTLVDAWGNLVNSTWGSKWFVPAGPIQRQILTDLIDALIVQVNPNAPVYYGQASAELSPSNPPPGVIVPVPPPTVQPPAISSPVILPLPVSPGQAAGSASAGSAPAQIIVRPPNQIAAGPPSGVSLVAQAGFAPNGQPIYSATNGKLYLGANGQYYDYAGPVLASPPTSIATPDAAPVLSPANAPALSTVPAGAATQATQSTIDQLLPLIQQAMAQGASQTQAYSAAIDRLATQGVQVTPQVQQAVAGTVANAGKENWYQNPLTMAALAVAALFATGVI